ncbi:ribonuclease H-like domain-containing protein [Tanacetum coccineum]
MGATNNEPQGIATGLIAGETKGVGFVTKGYCRNNDKKKWVTKDDKSHLKCEKCGMSRHTKEQCFRIVRYPDWRTDGNKEGAKPEKEKVPTTNTSSINKENTSVGCDGGDQMDIRTGWIIRRGTEREGLYYVDEVTTSGTVMLAHGTSKREAWLWHKRLGHPSSSSEESCPNQNTTSAGAHEQSSLNISVAKDTVPNLISEVSNSQPSDSLDEILENIHETVRVQEHEEPTLLEVPEKISRGNLSKEAKALFASLYSEEAPSNVEQALKSEKWKNVIDVEMDALMRNKTWDKCILLQGKKPVGCR